MGFLLLLAFMSRLGGLDMYVIIFVFSLFFSEHLFARGLYETTNVKNGQYIHEKYNCLACHTDLGYKREKSKSYQEVFKRVSRCNERLEAGMWEEDIEDLTTYLNFKYYKYFLLFSKEEGMVHQ